MEFCNHKFQQQPRYNIVYCNDINNEQSNGSKESHPNCSRGAQTPTTSHHGSEVVAVVGRVTCNVGHVTEDGNNIFEGNLKTYVYIRLSPYIQRIFSYWVRF